MDQNELAQALGGLLGPREVVFDVHVMLVRVGSGYIGTGELGGVVFRGNARPDAGSAARDLLMQLTQGVNADAGLALDLAASGETADGLDKRMRRALKTDGRSPAGAIGSSVAEWATADDADLDDAPEDEL